MKNLNESQRRRIREKINLALDALENLHDSYDLCFEHEAAQEIEDIMMQLQNDELKLEIIEKLDNLSSAQKKLFEKIKNKEQFTIPSDIFDIHKEDYDALEDCELIITERNTIDQIEIFIQPH